MFFLLEFLYLKGGPFLITADPIPTRDEIKQLSVYVPGKPVEEVQRELGLEKVIKLASNENPFGCSPLAKQAMVREIEKSAFYPEGLAPALVDKLAARLHVDKQKIIIGNGSDEIIRLLTRSYIRLGDEAIMADVTFPRYETNVLIEGGVPIKVPLIHGVHHLDGMYAAITKNTRMIFICNPNNPTGTIVPGEQLIQFIEKVPRTILIVIDEAYYEYVTDNENLQTIPLLDTYPNLVVLRTFSKIYGLAAQRIGFGIAQRSIIEALIKVKEPFNTNRIAQAAALASLDDADFLSFCQTKNEEGRRFLENKLDKMGLTYFPSHGNFMMVHVNRSGDHLFQALLELGIIIRSGVPLGLPEMIRVSIGTEEENMAFIQALRSVI